METPVHIEFQGMEPQEGLRVAVARHVAALEKRYGRITSCRVVLKSPGQHHRTGGFFEVHIRMLCRMKRRSMLGTSRMPTGATLTLILRSMMRSSMRGGVCKTRFVACGAM